MLSRKGVFVNQHWHGPGAAVLLLHPSTLRLAGTDTALVFHALRELRSDEKRHVWSKERYRLRNCRAFRESFTLTQRMLGTSGAGELIFLGQRNRWERPVSCRFVRLDLVRQDRKKQLRDDIMWIKKEPGRFDVARAAKARKMSVERYIDEQETLAADKVVQMLEHSHGILYQIDHPNIIRLEQGFRTRDAVYSMQEVVSGGSLQWYLKRGERLCEDEARVLILQIVQALQHLHHKHIVHNALTVDNIFVDLLRGVPRILLTEFGSATRDVWAASRAIEDMRVLGAITFLVLSAMAPARPGPTTRARSGTGRLVFPEGISEQAKSFTRAVWHTNRAEDRMTADQAAAHAWLAEEPFRAEFDEAYARLAHASKRESVPWPEPRLAWAVNPKEGTHFRIKISIRRASPS